ncbi:MULTISPECIES: DUF2071 domain-containing protein [unclassified Caballeronia]|uniref:DUF2071 domain-containing protein n=1 Tax=unclassified Caballeronia TaxID=2646786 RepID=UPI0028622E04|nr:MULTISPECIES: DUF2071 domain-containing protein [unclassified Caballeronia]MDR5740411.1 DUF2071 domain-containing protein [Caballeronia sp. LZ016]MDR5808410.1 DUF2071 domain-containing protein [Caballeronia sp. LZ019]
MAAGFNRLLNCSTFARARRAVLSRLPFMTMASDVVDVVYCTWIVDTADVAGYIPPGVALMERDGKTLFTILTYAHSHFGPSLAGPLRRLFPSPLQSNWRFYVSTFEGANDAAPTVLFVKNIFDNRLYLAATRMLSDALPSHLAARFEHRVVGRRSMTRIDSGRGSAPDFACGAQLTVSRALPEQFETFFDSWRRAVEFLGLQDGALAHVDDCSRIAHARIDLPIDIDSVRPMEPSGDVIGGDFLQGIGAKGRPFCFLVPGVKFRVLSERLL